MNVSFSAKIAGYPFEDLLNEFGPSQVLPKVMYPAKEKLCFVSRYWTLRGLVGG